MAAVMARLPRGRALSLAALVVGLGFGLTQFAHDGWTLAGTVAVWTLGELMQAAFMQALVTDLAPLRFRARYLGVFSVTFSTANAVGSPLGGVVLQRVGAGYLWSACWALGILAAVLFHIATRGMAQPVEVT